MRSKLEELLSKLVKEVLAETSVSGGGGEGASFSSGTGEQCGCNKAFKGKKKKYKPQVIIRKDLWK